MLMKLLMDLQGKSLKVIVIVKGALSGRSLYKIPRVNFWSASILQLLDPLLLQFPHPHLTKKCIHLFFL